VDLCAQASRREAEESTARSHSMKDLPASEKPSIEERDVSAWRIRSSFRIHRKRDQFSPNSKRFWLATPRSSPDGFPYIELAFGLVIIK
jgi:hypothetical protein